MAKQDEGMDTQLGRGPDPLHDVRSLLFSGLECTDAPYQTRMASYDVFDGIAFQESKVLWPYS